MFPLKDNLKLKSGLLKTLLALTHTKYLFILFAFKINKVYTYKILNNKAFCHKFDDKKVTFD